MRATSATDCVRHQFYEEEKEITCTHELPQRSIQSIPICFEWIFIVEISFFSGLTVCCALKRTLEQRSMHKHSSRYKSRKKWCVFCLYQMMNCVSYLPAMVLLILGSHRCSNNWTMSMLLLFYLLPFFVRMQMYSMVVVTKSDVFAGMYWSLFDLCLVIYLDSMNDIPLKMKRSIAVADCSNVLATVLYVVRVFVIEMRPIFLWTTLHSHAHVFTKWMDWSHNVLHTIVPVSMIQITFLCYGNKKTNVGREKI